MPPAARLGDMHVCPLVNPGPVPHVGGPILPACCPTVLIGGQPAARVTDLATCAGPPDVIVKGSPTVLIGNLFAARLGDNSVHGGAIVTGLPTVMIGESGSGGGGGGAGGAGGGSGRGSGGGGATLPAGAVLVGYMNGMPIIRLKDGSIRIGKNLVIKGTPEFQSKVLADLGKIASTPTGKSILNGIENGKHTTTIQELDLATAQKNGALAKREDPAGSTDPKKGSDTTISYNPDVKLQMTDQDGKPVDYPPESILGHELIHAVHNSNGENLRDQPDPKDPSGNQEESRTIGINDHKDEPMSENNLLKDLGAGFQRTDHDLSASTK